MKITAIRNEARMTEKGRIVFTIVSFDSGDTRAYWQGHLDPAKLVGALTLDLDFVDPHDFETFADPEELDWDEIEEAKRFAEVDGLDVDYTIANKKLFELARRAATDPEDVDRKEAERLNAVIAEKLTDPKNKWLSESSFSGYTMEELEGISKAVNE